MQLNMLRWLESQSKIQGKNFRIQRIELLETALFTFCKLKKDLLRNIRKRKTVQKHYFVKSNATF